MFRLISSLLTPALLLVAYLYGVLVGVHSYTEAGTGDPFSVPAMTGAAGDVVRWLADTTLHVKDASAQDLPTPDAIPTGHAPSLVGCVDLDDSDSNRLQNDDGSSPPSDPGPVYLRVEATKYLVAHLGTESGRSDRLAVVVFGGSGPDDLVTIPLTVIDGDAARRVIGDAIDRSIYSKRSTNYVRALSACLGSLDAAGYGRAPTGETQAFVPFVVMISDGRPEDSQAPAEQQLQDLRTILLPDLKSRGVRVFAIGYGSAGQPDSPQAQVMREIAKATDGVFLPAQNASDLLPLADSILAILAKATTMKAGAVTVWQQTSVDIGVPLNAESAFIGVRRSVPSIAIRLFDPAGSDVTKDTTNVEVSESETFVAFRVSAPRAGVWLVQATGDGTIEIDSSILTKRPPAAPSVTKTEKPSTVQLTATPSITPSKSTAGTTSIRTPTASQGERPAWRDMERTLKLASLILAGALVCMASVGGLAALRIATPRPFGKIAINDQQPIDLKQVARRRPLIARVLRPNVLVGANVDASLAAIALRFTPTSTQIRTHRRDVTVNGALLPPNAWRLLPSGSSLRTGTTTAVYTGNGKPNGVKRT